MRTSGGCRRILRVVATFIFTISASFFAALDASAEAGDRSGTVPVPQTQNFRPANNSQTVRDLLKAYDDESNVHERYIAFAQKADEEGFPYIGSLFRAAAESENIHLDNHARVLRYLGVEPYVRLKKPEVRSTRENLEAALGGETRERDVVYPSLIEHAKKANVPLAVQTFYFAKLAETQHAKLFEAALKDPGSWKSPRKTFYLCIICGFLTDSEPTSACPVCFESAEEFIRLD